MFLVLRNFLDRARANGPFLTMAGNKLAAKADENKQS
jgi:hypothetical protein